MEVSYSEGQPGNYVSMPQLVKLDDQWYVAGEGYIWEVESYKEGIRLIQQIRSNAKVTVSKATEQYLPPGDCACDGFDHGEGVH